MTGSIAWLIWEMDKFSAWVDPPMMTPISLTLTLVMCKYTFTVKSLANFLLVIFPCYSSSQVSQLRTWWPVLVAWLPNQMVAVRCLQWVEDRAQQGLPPRSPSYSGWTKVSGGPVPPCLLPGSTSEGCNLSRMGLSPFLSSVVEKMPLGLTQLNLSGSFKIEMTKLALVILFVIFQVQPRL